jgi:Leucine-rich repeat (LRR) protein
MAVHAQAQASRAHLICLCLCLLLSSSAHMARSMDLDDDAYDDDDSYSYQPPARRLYDGEERSNLLNTNSSRSNRSAGSAFCRLLSLQILDLSNNQLTGELPDCWWDMQALQFMDLSNNSFSGEIPAAPPSHNCTLESLHLAGNGFTGVFPSVVNGCSALATIDISNNRFSGNIPPWIGLGAVPSLKILSLKSNKFTGEIPAELSRLSNLQLLDLANNSLTGVIPKEFGDLVSMKNPKIVSSQASLDGSNYQDRIDIIWKGQNMIFQRILELVTGMDLSNNNLSQHIPPELTNLKGLRFLNLSRNHLSGGIPENIGSLNNLESLDLSSNQLSGRIPPDMSNFRYISTLNLSNNNLSGKIPGGDQLQTLTDPSIYANNPGLCGDPLLVPCTNASLTADTTNGGASQDPWLFYCVIAGIIFGSWLSFGMLFSVAKWRSSVFLFVDDMQCKIVEKMQDNLPLLSKGDSHQLL